MTSDDVITGEAPARYADALLDLATSAKSLNRVEKDLNQLAQILRDNDELRTALDNPVYSTDDKVAVLSSVATKAKLSALTKSFIGTVTSNRRAAELPAIIGAFQEKLALQRGTQVAKVVSASTLSDANLNQLKKALKSETGQAVELEASVDPALLGGFRVKLGSRVYDASLKTKLEDMRLALKS